jgi:hypothetical protein
LKRKRAPKPENTPTENLTEKMKFLNTIEESLFTAWNSFHPRKNIEDGINKLKETMKGNDKAAIEKRYRSITKKRVIN